MMASSMHSVPQAAAAPAAAAVPEPRAGWRLPAPRQLVALLADPAGPLALLLAALVALALAHYIFTTPFMRGLTPFWHQQDNDLAQYLAGFNAFVHEPWHWPLLRLTSVNAPDGTLVTFLDAIPLYALLLKLWQHGPDLPFRNPYALWLNACYLLQGAGAWWICREARTRSWIALAAMTVLLATFPPLTFRINHTSLMSQWLLLFGLAAYLRSQRLGRLASGSWIALLLIAFYINIYLFFMLALLFAADLLRQLQQGQLRRALATGTAAVVLLGGSLLLTMLPLKGDAGGGEWGFGYYSMNLLGPFAGGRLLQFPHPQANDGQGEGYAYVGIFLLMAVAYACTLRRRLDPAFWQRHRALTVVLIFMTCFALSNIVFLGTEELFRVNLPEWTAKLTSTFRSSGRFFWPVGYVLTAFAVVSLVRLLPPMRAALLLVLLVALQQYDLAPTRLRAREAVSVGAVERLHDAVWSGFFGPEVKDLQVYPPFGCGHGQPTQTVLPTMVYAVQHGMTISTGYIARVKRPCDNYAAEIAAHRSPASAFVFLKDDFPDRSAAEALLGGASAAQCIEADFAWLCQRTAAMENKK